MINCMKSVTTIPSSGDSTAREAKVSSSVLLRIDFNLSERDRELRQNEQILSSGRPSLGSSSHSQRNLRSPTFFAQPSIPQRHVTLRVGDQLKTIEDLRQKVRLLEEKISERDRLVSFGGKSHVDRGVAARGHLHVPGAAEGGELRSGRRGTQREDGQHERGTGSPVGLEELYDL